METHRRSLINVDGFPAGVLIFLASSCLILNLGLQVADVNPKSLCDFNPCDEAGCLHDPAARCITDFECNPVFFNVDGDMLSNCKGTLSPVDS